MRYPSGGLLSFLYKVPLVERRMGLGPILRRFRFVVLERRNHKGPYRSSLSRHGTGKSRGTATRQDTADEEASQGESRLFLSGPLPVPVVWITTTNLHQHWNAWRISVGMGGRFAIGMSGRFDRNTNTRQPRPLR